MQSAWHSGICAGQSMQLHSTTQLLQAVLPVPVDGQEQTRRQQYHNIQMIILVLQDLLSPWRKQQSELGHLGNLSSLAPLAAWSLTDSFSYYCCEKTYLKQAHLPEGSLGDSAGTVFTKQNCVRQ